MDARGWLRALDGYSWVIHILHVEMVPDGLRRRHASPIRDFFRCKFTQFIIIGRNLLS